jgi:hypothetical protein
MCPPMLGLPTFVYTFANRETFYLVGNIFSIASFFLSIFVLWNVRKLPGDWTSSRKTTIAET